MEPLVCYSCVNIAFALLCAGLTGFLAIANVVTTPSVKIFALTDYYLTNISAFIMCVISISTCLTQFYTKLYDNLLLKEDLENYFPHTNSLTIYRFRVNNSTEVLIVAVEIEVSSGASLRSALTSKALKINFEPIVIPGDTEIPIAVETLAYDWKAGLYLKHFKGKLMIKSIVSGGSSQKLAIRWVAEVLRGGLEVNTSAAYYCSPYSSQPRNLSVVNKFKLPLAITNVPLPSAAASLFTISNFDPKITRSGQRDNIFTLSLTHDD